MHGIEREDDEFATLSEVKQDDGKCILRQVGESLKIVGSRLETETALGKVKIRRYLGTCSSSLKLVSSPRHTVPPETGALLQIRAVLFISLPEESYLFLSWGKAGSVMTQSPVLQSSVFNKDRILISIGTQGRVRFASYIFQGTMQIRGGSSITSKKRQDLKRC